MMSNRRLVLEYNAMRERWGENPRLCKSASEERLWWEYSIHLEGNVLPIKIAYPDVCRHYRIECIRVTDLFRREGWKF